MAERRKPGVIRGRATDQEMRDQEVLRDRDRRDASSRPPLPGGDVANSPKEAASRKPASESGARHRRKARRNARDKSSKNRTVPIEPQMSAEPREPSESDERPPE